MQTNDIPLLDECKSIELKMQLGWAMEFQGEKVCGEVSPN